MMALRLRKKFRKDRRGFSFIVQLAFVKKWTRCLGPTSAWTRK
jgi:hypothetical protein